jgi:transcription initiation factor TFIIIB Brf1 subunit/transcription initiation factor TFIIB
MKYDKETTARLLELYGDGTSTKLDDIAAALSVPKRSVIAKLSSLGLYKKAPYVTKQGLPPIKKEEYIEKIAAALEVNLELLESLEKCNKNVLKLLLEALDV